MLPMKQPLPTPSTTSWSDPGEWTEPTSKPEPRRTASPELSIRKTGDAVVDALEASFARRGKR